MFEKQRFSIHDNISYPELSLFLSILGNGYNGKTPLSQSIVDKKQKETTQNKMK